MAQIITDRPTAKNQPTGQNDAELARVTTRALRCLTSAIIFLSALLILSACSATGRQFAKKSVLPQEPTPSRETGVVKPENKPPPDPTSSPEAKATQQTPQAEEKPRNGKTELEIVKNIARDLAKKYSPVENMTICYATREDEWWITLFQDEGHAFELKRYIWTKRNDKVEPFLVPKRIARGDLTDYLNEKPLGKECTAFEHTKNGWTAMKHRSSAPHTVGSPKRPKKPQNKAARRAHHSQAPRPEDLRLVSGDDEKPALKIRNVSIPLHQSTDYVFAYGSEMKHTDLLRWLRAHGYDTGLVVDASAATLDGYDFVWNYYSPVKAGGTANIEPRRDAVVWGLLLEVDSRLIAALDRKQGHPMSYGRGHKRIPVRRVEDSRTVLAWVYTAKPNRDGRTDIWPTPKYKNRIVEAATFWGFPRQYVDRIKKWNTSR